MDISTLREAATATEHEHRLGLRDSLRLYRKACLWSIFFSTCIVMEGFDLNLINSLLAYPPFQRKFGDEILPRDGNGPSYQLTAAWQSGLSNGTLCGQILGLFASGIVADRFGYRKTLIGSLCACIGFIFIFFFAESLTQLLIGEILVGVPWGVFQTLTTTYASEVCPTHLRAYLTAYSNLCWVIGQFISAGVLRAMLSRDDDWGFRIPFALQWAWPVPLMIGIWIGPESPWWLVRHGRIEDAKQALLRLTVHHSGVVFDANETISMMIHTNKMEERLVAGTGYLDLFRGSNRRRTEIVCMTWMIQVLCGSSLMGYSTYFYEQAGLGLETSFSMSLGQYGIGALGTILSWFFMNWFGRRSLYLFGLIAMFILFLVTSFAALAGRNDVAAQWAIGSLLLAYTFIYDTTVGPVCYCLVSELSSTRLRAKSLVLARNMYNMVGIISNIVTPRMLNPTAWDWGAKSAFFWAGSCFLCAWWAFFRLPEPKGRTYGELDRLFEQGVSARRFATVELEAIDINADVRRPLDEGRLEKFQKENGSVLVYDGGNHLIGGNR